MSLDIGRETARAVVSRDALDRLATFEPGDARVLTAYLDLSPERRARRAWAIVLKDLAHDVREGLGKRCTNGARRGDLTRPGLARHGEARRSRRGHLQLRVA